MTKTNNAKPVVRLNLDKNQVEMIDKAAEKTLRSRNSFVSKSAIDKAKKINEKE